MLTSNGNSEMTPITGDDLVIETPSHHAFPAPASYVFLEQEVKRLFLEREAGRDRILLLEHELELVRAENARLKSLLNR